MSQYYSKAKLSKYIGIPEKMGFELIKTDSYNEQKVEESIVQTGMVEELKCCAIQTAIVGSGNGILGNIKLGGIEASVRKIYLDADVKLDLPKTAVISESELTPRRLQRFFRYTIADYMKKNEVSSYLYTKYSDHDEKYRFMIFPGFEHMVEEIHDASYLFITYLRLDFKLKTTISERIYRILSTRGILTIAELDKIKDNFNQLAAGLSN